MNKTVSNKLFWSALTSVTLLLINLAGTLVPHRVTADGNTATIRPSAATINVGDEFQLVILLKTVEPSNTFACALQWSGRGQIKCIGVEEGTFYKEHGTTMLVGNTDFDPYQGWVPNEQGAIPVLSVSLMGATAPAGEKPVLILRFMAEATGDVDIKFVRRDRQGEIGMLYNTDPSNMQQKLLNISTTDTRITVAQGEGGGFSGTKPNLVIDSIRVKQVGQDFNIEYTVKNIGGVKSGDFRVGLYINDDKTPVTTEDVKSLEPGGKYSGNFDRYKLRIGAEDILKVWADDNNKLDQSDTHKHWDTWPYRDLIIRDISASWINEGNTYEINYKVKNIGSRDLDKSFCSISINGKEETQECQALSTGQERTYKFGPITLGDAGSDTIRICADSMETVQEDREDNNCKEHKWPEASGSKTKSKQPDATTTGGGKKGNAEGSEEGQVVTITPEIPETRPATPGITISWEYLAGIVGLFFLSGLTGFILGRLRSNY